MYRLDECDYEDRRFHTDIIGYYTQRDDAIKESLKIITGYTHRNRQWMKYYKAPESDDEVKKKLNTYSYYDCEHGGFYHEIYEIYINENLRSKKKEV